MKRKIRLFSIIALSLLSLQACRKDEVVEQPIDKDNFYRIAALDFTTSIPHQVNILLQVTDYDQIGVDKLTVGSFSVKENGKEVGSEASATLAPFGDIPSSIRTVLLLDVSISVQNNLEQIKTAAKALINQKPDFQEFAILTFSSNPEMIRDFTTDASLLNSAIDDIEIGTSSTNLYGAIIEAAAKLQDSYYSVQEIKVSNMIVLTDGDDTQASSTLADAIAAVEGRDVYMLGLGAEMNQETMKKLGQFHLAENIAELENTFIEVQQNIERTANSVYWIYYQTPKRGDNEHQLTVEVVGNSNTSSSAVLKNTFNSGIFGDPTGTPPLAPANPTPAVGSTGLGNLGMLIWECSDPDGDNLKYDVYLGRTSNPPLIAKDISASSFRPENLVLGEKYYWKVVAKDTNYNLTEGPVWNFIR